jgi:tetratricopeptide (TPR) repeat protein
VLQIAGELGYRRAESMARYELADVLRGLGEYTQALLQFEHALASLQESGEPFVENYASIDIGRLYAYMGNYTQAAHLIAQALARSDHFTMPDAKLDTWLAASLLHRLTGKNVESLHYATRCHQVAQARGTRRYQGYAALYMGHALEGLARWPEAHTAYSAALELYQQLDIQPIIAEAQAGLVRTTLALGDQAAAQSWVEKLLLLLDEQPTIGLDEPFQIYLTGYQILAANADPRAATILHRGAAELLRYRAQITDQTLQHTFLEAVPTHRALYAAYTDRSFNWPQPVPA